MIKAVFTDIDNTLLDFRKNSALTVRSCLEMFGLEYTDEIFDTFYEVNNLLWKKIENGSLTKERLHLIRWNTIFSKLGIDLDGIEFEKHFVKGLEEYAEPVDNALEVLRYLSSKYPVYAASNASRLQQDKRLKTAGMSQYIKKVFSSEEIGFQKPDKRFFEECVSRVPGGISNGEIIMIGDSLTADISGGINSGMKTCWFNLFGAELPRDIKPDYIISDLREICQIL